jgi:hypothetical protein
MRQGIHRAIERMGKAYNIFDENPHGDKTQ